MKKNQIKMVCYDWTIYYFTLNRYEMDCCKGKNKSDLLSYLELICNAKFKKWEFICNK